MFWTGSILAFALSIDGFVAGLSYGFRRIHVPMPSLLIIAACTGTCMGVSMLFGEAVATLVSVQSARALGGAILVCIGLWHLLNSWSEYVRSKLSPGTLERLLFAVRVRPLKIVVHVLVDPAHGDQDASGTIDTKEAIFLGVALGLDALGAGFAAAMLGFGLSLVAVVTVGLPLLVWMGMVAGHRLGSSTVGQRILFIPGAILIIMGALQF